MPQVVVKDILINYSDSGGNKPILLCIHGWMHDNSSFNNITEELKDKFRVIAIDLPNFGASQMTEEVISIDDYAAFLKLLIDKLDIKDYYLVGHSMGGQIAIRSIANKIINPQKLILIATAGIRDTRKIYKVFLKVVSKFVKYIIPARIKNSFYKSIGSDYNTDLSDTHKKIIGQTLSTDILSDAKSLNLPVLLICGSLDKSTPLWMGEKLHKNVSNSSLKVIEGESHWLHQTSSGKVAAEIKSFI